MALKRLTTEEMVQLSGPWVTEGTPAREAILSVKETAGVLPRVEGAHAALHATQPGTGNPRLIKLQEEAAAGDLDHDTLVRGTFMFLTGLSMICGSPATAESLLKLRDFLFPEGLELTQKTYRAEAGAAELLKTRLAGDASAKKQLKEIPVLKKNLGQIVDLLIQTGQRLGELEDERAALLATPAGPSDGGKLQTARNQWIRAVNALVANAELAEIPEDVQNTIFSALRLAEKRADRRIKASGAGETPAPELEKAPE